MVNPNLRARTCNLGEYLFVLLFGLVALTITSVPYLLGAALATEERIFGGFVYATEDCYSYLAKMRQGAEGAWLFRIAYTAETHPRALFFPFHLLLGKVAALLPGSEADLTTCMVWVYHGARWVCGLILLATTYRFLAAFTQRVEVRRLAWLMVTFGGGLGWLLVAVGQPGWLGSMPLDFILPEGFTFLVLYAFPHIALARSLLLWGFLFLLRAWDHSDGPDPRLAGLKWAARAGFLWLAMGLIVPFYVGVAWAVMGAAWVALGMRRRRVCWRQGWLAGLAVALSAPIVAYSGWVFTTDEVYRTWAAQNLVLSPHPFHYLAAYGVLLAWAAFAAREAWLDEGPAWLALAWVVVVPLLVYLPFNLQRRLVEGVQVPLSLLAAWGVFHFGWRGFRLGVIVAFLLIGLALTNVMLVAGNCLALRGRPAPIYRDAEEVAVMDWLSERVDFEDVVLTTYESGNYLPARARARVFVGHGPETVRADEKKALVARFYDATTGDGWRRRLLDEYGVDYVFWGPTERALGAFEPQRASYLAPAYRVGDYAVFEVTGD